MGYFIYDVLYFIDKLSHNADDLRHHKENKYFCFFAVFYENISSCQEVCLGLLSFCFFVSFMKLSKYNFLSCYILILKGYQKSSEISDFMCFRTGRRKNQILRKHSYAIDCLIRYYKIFAFLFQYKRWDIRVILRCSAHEILIR